MNEKKVIEIFRVIRGGSWWDDGPTCLRSAYRNWRAPSYRDNDLGFRLVLRKSDLGRGMNNQNEIIELLLKACETYKAASFQGHNQHFDFTGRGGLGCPECIRADRLRLEADEIMSAAMRIKND